LENPKDKLQEFGVYNDGDDSESLNQLADLLKRMLHYDYDERISIEEI